MSRWNNRLAPGIISRVKLARARELRQQSTLAEARAWRLLRNRRMLGLKFKRQRVIAGFFVDFYCAELKLIVELDGSAHDGIERADYDKARMECLEARGIEVLRIRNQDVSEEQLRKALSSYACRSPSPQRGEGDRGEGY